MLEELGRQVEVRLEWRGTEVLQGQGSSEFILMEHWQNTDRRLSTSRVRQWSMVISWESFPDSIHCRVA